MEPRSHLTVARGCGLLVLGGALLAGALGAAVVYGQLHLDVGPGKLRFYIGTPPPDWHARALPTPVAPAAPTPPGVALPAAHPVPAAPGPHVGIGLGFTGAPEVDADIESTLVFASSAGMERPRCAPSPC